MSRAFCFRTYLIVVGLLAACSSSSTPDETKPSRSAMHKQHFDKSLGMKLTDKQRAILEDYWVTDEEWHDLVSDFYNCAEEKGTKGAVGVDVASYGAHQDRIDLINRDYDTVDERFEQLHKEEALIVECAGA